MDRETESRSKLDTFHLKQTVHNNMHRFLELYQTPGHGAFEDGRP